MDAALHAEEPVAASATSSPAAVVRVERVRVPAPRAVIVVPLGMPGPEIVWPTEKAPQAVATFVRSKEPAVKEALER